MTEHDTEAPASRPAGTGPTVWVDDLDHDVCWTLIARQPVGRIAFVVDGVPHVYPVNHRTDGVSVVFRTERDSSLSELAGTVVAFEVDDANATAETGWSVHVTGELREVTDAAEHAALAALDVHPWAPGDKDRWLRLEPTSISGRAISRRVNPDTNEVEPYRPWTTDTSTAS
ncbi:MAG TPA: pyridoxamine 5'-phosphate oxidase family protein [Acidimicrobiales bacterium]